MLRLMLLRHAKAIHSAHYDDFERPLIRKGEEGAALIGELISDKCYKPDLALVSAARRTRQTWEIVKEYAGSPRTRYDQALYLASPNEILTAIRNADSTVSALLVVGHNPGLALLAASLAGKGRETGLSDLRVKFPTGALAVVDFDIEDWSAIGSGGGTLVEFVYPGLLRPEH